MQHASHAIYIGRHKLSGGRHCAVTLALNQSINVGGDGAGAAVIKES